MTANRRNTHGIEHALLEVRSRMQYNHVIEGSTYETRSRLATLRKTLENLGEQADPEVFRHFPVASIASLETHFKAIVASIVDSGPPYLERGVTLLPKEKFKAAVAELLPAVHRGRVSLGDFIASVLPFNSVASIDDALSRLLNESFRNMLSSVRDPYFVRQDRAHDYKIVPDVEALLKALAITFEQRHVLAHEAAGRYVVSYSDALQSVESVSMVVDATDAVLWGTIWRDVPLTQFELNEHAGRRYLETRKELALKVKLALRIATEDGIRGRFRHVHSSWKAHSRNWIAFEDDNFAMGSIRPLMAALVRDRLYKSRLNELTEWVSWRRSDLSRSEGESISARRGPYIP